MTKEEAIQRFQRMKKILAIPNSEAERTMEAIDMAIEALQQETVSRESYDHEFNLRKAFEMQVFELEKKIAEQEDRPKRKWNWMADCGVTECDQCGWSIAEYVGDYNFCPNCGSDNRERREE